MIAFDERIDSLIVSSIFGESVSGDGSDGAGSETQKGRTSIEAALVEAFARVLGEGLEAALASVARVTLSFERLTTINDVYALGRRDGDAAAARFTLDMNGGACECLLLLPQAFLLPFRAELANDPEAEALPPDRRWSRLMEAGVQQTRLPVTAILEEVPMNLGDVANFQIGGLLPLQCNDFTAIRLECSGRGMFTCKLGQADGRYRLEVESPITKKNKAAHPQPETTPLIANASDTPEQDISWTQPPSPPSRSSPSTRRSWSLSLALLILARSCRSRSRCKSCSARPRCRSPGS